MGNYSKRIICDLDDTICRTLNRDWVNAEPIMPVIEKINRLYDYGWEIWIVTARGQLSCNGDSEKADRKYRPQIEIWLNKHGVKYHQLSFQKKLATYYIDDKNLTPEQFVDLDIKTLSGGWSGATVELREGRVFKTHHDTLEAAKWFKVASRFVNVPEIYSVIGETICMEYIESDCQPKIPDIVKVIDLFRDIPPIYNQKNGIVNYIERITHHCKTNDDFYEIIPVLKEELRRANTGCSFCHGDMSLENILCRDGKIYLIDPISGEGKFSSWMLDASKLLYSLRRHEDLISYEWVMDYFTTPDHGRANSRVLTLLELTHFIRVFKYAPESEKAKLKENIDYLMSFYVR